MRSGFLPARVVQVHPTRRCNLACAHCYSESGPNVREEIEVDLLLEGLAQFRDEGYEIMSVSGGEPLVYRHLDRLVKGARQQGYRVHMISNGGLLTERRLETLARNLFLVGISLDGAEETHNTVRGRPDAFQNAIRAMKLLAKWNVPFGIIYAVTARSLPDIPWAFELAESLGASLLHLRPLAPIGRGRSLDETWTLNEHDCARLFVLAQVLSTQSSPSLRVQVDLVASENLAEAREQFELLRPYPQVKCLSDAVNPLIIDSQGRCLPFAYGMDSRFELGRLRSGETIHPGTGVIEEITELIEATFQEVEAAPSGYSDWFAHLAHLSHARKPMRSLVSG
jgi:Fe-coproporphyrin III synthase